MNIANQTATIRKFDRPGKLRATGIFFQIGLLSGVVTRRRPASGVTIFSQLETFVRRGEGSD